MSGAQLLFLLIVFAVVVALALLAWLIFFPGTLRQRLFGATASAASEAVADTGWVERVVRVAQPFSKLSLPEEGWERSPLRTRFMNAGWRQASAPALYFAAKSVLALLFPTALGLYAASAMAAQLRSVLLLLLCVSATIGYYLPNLVLASTAKRRQRDIFENIPDALDLLTVCVEAGLSLERALVKVSGEIHIKSVVLAQELQLVLMEMRAGFSKEKALRNLALRSGVEDVDTLVAMLIQSERFGTSMGDSLRVHSENLRGKRSLLAEEAAAKIALKLLFPLIFCVFPTLMLVLMGPAVIEVYRVLVPAMASR
ncbi:bacterial type II secretion system protein F domain protein [Janthinobacterium sp. HH103]|uniref:type II secretion system F family protein n=1 Tax=unclassified Janthinobacterium TaxID=2610881 RepID=UPI000875A8EE|nr:MULTISPECIES: type II secretion system F family protein [unclassified Janthinobacterium]OEZ65324.1 bacterial type II secretion system protein F domain protein [Janthinobacterium sp. HH100]OEZ84524.1 bacterial type II secretion system protein F domain protein [Janthinobacterium sp. HH103]OEZ93691.1 bacterial type II secretion system protein F domain protein [Janthinobacterium sp. HH107]QOU71121.1 Type II secretion system (T2SS), protein F [Janthinobacterium sp. HH102]